jgi:hypothetical protein
MLLRWFRSRSDSTEANRVPLDQIRDIVRSELVSLAASAKPEKKEVLYFFNTSLGLWLLSSVFVGGITFAYTTLTTNWAAERARVERFARLDAELELRFQPILKRIEELQSFRTTGNEKDKPDATIDETEIEEPVTTTVNGTLKPEETALLFHKPKEDEQYQHEFAKYTVKALFAEGYFLSRNANEKAAIHAALSALEHARQYEYEGALLDSGQLVGARVSVTVEQQKEGSDFQKQLVDTWTKFYLDSERRDHANGRGRYEQSIVDAWNLWQRRQSYDPRKTQSPVPIAEAEQTPKPKKLNFEYALTASLEAIRGPRESGVSTWNPATEQVRTAEALKAITAFHADPSAALRSGAAKTIADFAEDSPAITITLDRRIIPWIKGEVDERRTILLAAYFAGSTESQLKRGGIQDADSAGVWQAIDTYRQLQQSDPTFRLEALEALIQIEKNGRLQEHVHGE